MIVIIFPNKSISTYLTSLLSYKITKSCKQLTRRYSTRQSIIPTTNHLMNNAQRMKVLSNHYLKAARVEILNPECWTCKLLPCAQFTILDGHSKLPPQSHQVLILTWRGPSYFICHLAYKIFKKTAQLKQWLPLLILNTCSFWLSWI